VNFLRNILAGILAAIVIAVLFLPLQILRVCSRDDTRA